jgi:hypothetical protein
LPFKFLQIARIPANLVPARLWFVFPFAPKIGRLLSISSAFAWTLLFAQAPASVFPLLQLALEVDRPSKRLLLL